MIDSEHLSDRDVATILNAARANPTHHALLAVIANCGIRPGEANRLTIADVDFGPRPRLKLVRPHCQHGWRRAYTETIPMTRSLSRLLMLHIARMPNQRPESRLFPMTRRGVEYAFSRWAARANVKIPQGKRKSLGVLALRYAAFIRLMKASNNDIVFLRYMMGSERPFDTMAQFTISEAQARAHLQKIGALL